MNFKDWLKINESSYNTRRRKGLDPPRAEDYGSRSIEPEYIENFKKKLKSYPKDLLYNIDISTIMNIPTPSPKSSTIPPVKMPEDVLDYIEKSKYPNKNNKKAIIWSNKG